MSTAQEDMSGQRRNSVQKTEILDETMEEIPIKEIVQDTIDENGDEVEEVTQVTRKVVKRTMKITETSSTTKTTSLTAPAKLYGKDLSEYDEVDVDALLAQLSPEEINILAKEVDPDDNFLPPDQRCSYECTKSPTGPLDRKKLIEHINKQALETPDQPEFEPYVKGTVRGKKWIPPPRDQRALEVEEQIAIDMGDEYEQALSHATQEEIIDLAAILGFHSMMNQDQYHASLLNKGQPVGLGWDGITKSTQQKVYPMDPPNNTDVEESIKRVKEDDPKLIELNFNNIKNISDEKFEQLFEVLPKNEHLEVLSLTNVGLTDKTALLLAEAIEKSKTLRVLNVETNFISPPVVVKLVKALLKCRTIEEFRASNQRSAVLGNKIEMEITDLVEKNTSLLRLGLHLEFNDARHRVAAHLQRNIDRSENNAENTGHSVKSSSLLISKAALNFAEKRTMANNPNEDRKYHDKEKCVNKSSPPPSSSSSSSLFDVKFTSSADAVDVMSKCADLDDKVTCETIRSSLLDVAVINIDNNNNNRNHIIQAEPCSLPSENLTSGIKHTKEFDEKEI
ncbi:tropomodulin isoform X3 [Glossina fuscipes]|uniref:Tropomodulin isoform X3 n=1 Tax=Glossina fuscipes TaxID=7396 RepID=A0A8U0WI24_9MUSC|nr:tropomodulin isoform X3 [Glossina fuscipes]